MALKRPRSVFVVVLLALLLALLSTTATFAQEEPPLPPRPTLPEWEIPSELPPLPDNFRVMEDTPGPLGEQPGSRGGHFMVEFQGAPAVQVYAEALASGQSVEAATAAGVAAGQSYAAAQAAVRPQIEAVGASVLYEMQRTYNGVAIYLDDARKLVDILALPNVKAVHVLPLHTIDNETSVPFIGAPGVWETYGLTGEDVTIAIIDTGIDYLHLDFGGSADYTTQDPTVIDAPFPTDKVIDGWDFSGDNYDAGGTYGPTTPSPDPDPTDCYGHGTHVAGTAAGYGVYDDMGTPTTYFGPYDTSIYPDNWIVGPGVAPEAKLVAFKVFGCDGSTALTELAIETTVDPNGDFDFSDHYDVINMSLGSSYGSPDDPSTIATNNAALAGVLVAASAGNSSDIYFISGSPGSATRAVSTAGVNDPDNEALALVDGDGVSYLAIPAAFGPPITTPVTGTLEVPATATGCDAAAFTGFTPGNIALINRGACDFSLKVYNAQVAGAVAAVVTNVTTNLPFGMGAGTNAGLVTIPSVMISGDDGWTIKDKLPTTGTLDPANVIPLAGMAYTSSSRGPQRGAEVGLKPDLANPAVNVTSAFSAWDGTGSTMGGPSTNPGEEAVTVSGTSMASPHTAGALALMRQAHPRWTVEEIKAALMNTAYPDVPLLPGFPLVSPVRIGSGIMDLGAAFNTEVIAYSADSGAVSVAFDFEVPGKSKGNVVKQVFITNKSDVDQMFDVVIDTAVDSPGLKVKVSPDYIVVPARRTVALSVEVEYDGAQMSKFCDPSIDPPAGFRHCLGEESGHVLLTGGTQDLRVPFLVTAVPTSDMGTVVDTYHTPAWLVDIPLSGTGVNVDGPSDWTDQVSLVSAYELVGRSMNDTWSMGMAENADLQAVGVSADPYYTGWVYTGIATYGDWNTPTEVEFDIYIDSDKDGASDWVVFNCTSGGGAYLNTCFADLNGWFGYGAGAVLSFGDPINGIEPFADTRVFNTNVLNLSVPSYYFEMLATIYGSDTDWDYNWYVLSFSRDFDGSVDAAPMFGWYNSNAIAPAVTFLNWDIIGYEEGPLPVWPDVDGGAVTVELWDYFEGEVLLLHHYNSVDDRVEVVSISNDVPDYEELVSNGGFETGDLTGWTTKNLRSGDGVTDANASFSTYSMLFSGGATKARKIKQVVSGPGSSGDQFYFYAASYPDGAVGTAVATVTIKYVDGTKHVETLDLMGPDGIWTSQYTSAFVATKDYDKVVVKVKVKLDSGNFYLDEIQLWRWGP